MALVQLKIFLPIILIAQTGYKYETLLIKLDIKFLITCNRKNLAPVFSKPKLAIKINQKTRNKFMNTIIEAKLKNKYKEKKRLTQELNEKKNVLYSNLFQGL